MSPNKSILPPNATQLQKDLEAASIGRLSLLNVDALRYLANPEQCKIEFLPWLAWAVSVDVWDTNWSQDIQRSIVRESIQIHQRKGTVGGLKRTLESFITGRIRVAEWFEYGGEPYTFRVYATYKNVGMTMEDVELIYSAIIQTKNLRSHLEFFLPEIESEDSVPKYGMAFGHLEITTIYPREDNV